MEQQRAPGRRTLGPIVAGAPRLGVGPADVRGFPAGRALPPSARLGRILLVVVAILGTAASIPAFYIGFWLLLDLIRLIAGAPYPFPLFAASFPAAIAAVGVLYLVTDRIGSAGDEKMRRALTEKAACLFAPEPLPARCFYVEARTERGRFRLRDDRGLLILLADRLVFAGDQQTATFPPTALTGEIRRDRNPFHMGPAWITVELIYPWGRLRLLARDTAARLSDTHWDAVCLERALRTWLDATAQSTDTQPPAAAER